VFLDRDGTICRDPGRARPAALRLLPGVPAALGELRRAGFRLIVVTNQAAVARGVLMERELDGEHKGLAAQLLASGVGLDAVYYCPHHAAAPLARYRLACSCRKPEPGLLLRAARENGIDPARSYMVGDKASDIAAGRRAGCRSDKASDIAAGRRAGCRTVLVLTGETPAGAAARGYLTDAPDFIAADLAVAARLITG